METASLMVKDWTTTPGLRYRWQGSFSGEEYFEDRVLPVLDAAQSGGLRVTIVLDGTRGYASSFIDELFGRIAEKYGYEWANTHISVVSVDRPWLTKEAQQAMVDRS